MTRIIDLRYKIEAFDKSHNKLWIDFETGQDCDGSLSANSMDVVSAIYSSTALGYEIDAETEQPDLTHRRRVAYFRTSERGTILEIYATHYGRQSRIRNYQMRRWADTRAAAVSGARPLDSDPYLDVRYDGLNIDLVFGEGQPGESMVYRPTCVDRWADPVVVAASACRVFASETQGKWHGWVCSNWDTSESVSLISATRADVEKWLREAGAKMVEKYGMDITGWMAQISTKSVTP